MLAYRLLYIPSDTAVCAFIISHSGSAPALFFFPEEKISGIIPVNINGQYSDIRQYQNTCIYIIKHKTAELTISAFAGCFCFGYRLTRGAKEKQHYFKLLFFQKIKNFIFCNWMFRHFIKYSECNQNII